MVDENYDDDKTRKIYNKDLHSPCNDHNHNPDYFPKPNRGITAAGYASIVLGIYVILYVVYRSIKGV